MLEAYSPTSITWPSSPNNSPRNLRKPRVLCLHGWRTNGQILAMQMAAFRANCDIEAVFLNAPYEAEGDCDPLVAEFYGGHRYYEWFYRREKNELLRSTTEEDSLHQTNLDHENNNSNDNIVLLGIEDSIKWVIDYVNREGPFDGILGFSQGAHMVTRVLAAQVMSKKNLLIHHPFKFCILIGGVPPEEIIAHKKLKLNIPSLHIMGSQDPYLPKSQALTNYYGDAKGKKRVILHSEGHNIPSIRTGLYPSIKNWINKAMNPGLFNFGMY